MRVDAFAQIQSMYNLGNKNKQVKTETTKSFSDQLQISSIGKDLRTAKQAVASSADVREDLVADIKSKIDAGTYSVDSDSLAEKLFAKFDCAI
ncbi:MAG: flagellar biosynthesis anti-sigma factor FlgM [Lachnospiraceae bacterium]|jgi:negative regulator of flagellin synthesis FlgM|nr:flagellar biosynthesis anti-sigma factor FlgM [Lachnospiraceae bacterium]MBR6147804.1 flagellar biosynthesis anti-sigma factor FlgM [Lachnospiraceae bacterium]MCR4866884.1 flagellar biosynthesis anti-sigma factor FlgM [Lachnospiraceae bacterium]